MTTKITRCTCKHAAQDEMYGVGNRVANEMRNGQLKCTVCGTIQGSQFVARPVKATEEPVVSKKEKSDSKKSSKEKKPKAKRGLKWGKK